MGRTLNLFGLLDQTAARFGDRGAVYHGQRQLHTWAELRDRALCLAASIRAIDGPRARISVASEIRPEIVELMFAIWAAECVVVPINYKLHPREMMQILDDAGVVQVFASPKIAERLPNAEIVSGDTYSARIGAAPLEPPRITDPSTL